MIKLIIVLIIGICIGIFIDEIIKAPEIKE